jgi:hypothetical protein
MKDWRDRFWGAHHADLDRLRGKVRVDRDSGTVKVTDLFVELDCSTVVGPDGAAQAQGCLGDNMAEGHFPEGQVRANLNVHAFARCAGLHIVSSTAPKPGRSR